MGHQTVEVETWVEEVWALTPTRVFPFLCRWIFHGFHFDTYQFVVSRCLWLFRCCVAHHFSRTFSSNNDRLILSLADLYTVVRTSLPFLYCFRLLVSSICMYDELISLPFYNNYTSTQSDCVIHWRLLSGGETHHWRGFELGENVSGLLQSHLSCLVIWSGQSDVLCFIKQRFFVIFLCFLIFISRVCLNIAELCETLAVMCEGSVQIYREWHQSEESIDFRG